MENIFLAIYVWDTLKDEDNFFEQIFLKRTEEWLVTWLKYCRYGVKFYPINQCFEINNSFLGNGGGVRLVNGISYFILYFAPRS